MKEKLVIDKNSRLFPVIITLFAVSLGAAIVSPILQDLGYDLRYGDIMTAAQIFARFIPTLLSGTTLALIITCIKPARKGGVYLLVLAVSFLLSVARALYNYFIIPERYRTFNYTDVMNIISFAVDLAALVVFALTVFGVIKSRKPVIVMYSVGFGITALSAIVFLVLLALVDSLNMGDGTVPFLAGRFVLLLTAAAPVAYLLLMFTFEKEAAEK